MDFDDKYEEKIHLYVQNEDISVDSDGILQMQNAFPIAQLLLQKENKVNHAEFSGTIMFTHWGKKNRFFLCDWDKKILKDFSWAGQENTTIAWKSGINEEQASVAIELNGNITALLPKEMFPHIFQKCGK